MEKMLETVKVETYLKRVRCPNKDCVGTLEADGKERAEGGMHGGKTEYRHLCTVCSLGAWMSHRYPQVEYKQVLVGVTGQKLEIKDSEKPIGRSEAEAARNRRADRSAVNAAE